MAMFITQKDAKEASIKYDEVHEGNFPNEVVVVFSTVSGKMAGIFNMSAINKEDGSISVYIIGEQGDKYLIDLPTYTFTSGSRAWIDKKAVLLKE